MSTADLIWLALPLLCIALPRLAWAALQGLRRKPKKRAGPEEQIDGQVSFL
ncbi:MAG: hypothetical protein LBD02_01355 [Christensenellaceae bacterium]|jgi:hypothetical protein|nr:hypothetical protein [Christensenellaceae bacterium]